MPHIHTSPGQHDATVSFLIARPFDDGAHRIAFHTHKRTGVLATFGGHIELDESPWQAVLRELTEESGYLPEQVSVLQPLDTLTRVTGAVVHPVPVLSWTGAYPGETRHFHTDLLYALATMEDPAGTPAAGESTDIRWLTRFEISELDDSEVTGAFRDAAVYVLDRIWDWAFQTHPASAYGS